MLSYSVDPLIQAMGTGYYILVYGIGVLAMIFNIFAFRLKHRVAIILCNFIGQ